MSQRTRRYSIMHKITTAFIIVFFALFLLMLINNMYVINTTRQRTYDRLYGILEQQNRQISSELMDASTYLASFALSADLKTVERNKKDTNFYSAIHRMQNELKNTLPSLSILDGVFTFSPNNQLFFFSANSYVTSDAISIKGWIRNAYSASEMDHYIKPQWFALEIDGQYYLLHVLRIGQSYVGAWTSFSQILSRVQNAQSMDQTALFAYSKDEVFNMESQASGYELDPAQADQGFQLLDLDEKYIAISNHAPYTENGAIFLLIPDSQITLELINVYLLLMITGVMILVIAIIFVFVLQRYLRWPINQLLDSIKTLRTGDFSVRVPEEYTCKEFTEVNQAFNSMVERIDNLKINVYEEKLHQQRTEMTALKNQIAPHFLINCLNAIYHMAATGRNDKIRNMTVRLSDNLRYALADVTIVPLKKEIEEAINYVELSKLRFPDSVQLHIDIDVSMQDALVVPMILLFQIENTVKYEVVNGALTEIFIEARIVDHDNGKYVLLRIWDTGGGYSDEFLRQMEHGEMLNQADGHNIGTKNVYQRMHYLFGDHFSMRFCNRPGAGAQIELEFPYRSELLQSTKETDHEHTDC